MRGLAVVLTALAGHAVAQDWQRLGDEAIREALAGRTLIFDAYTFQTFAADGSTQFVTERASDGRWEARGGQYCSTWPPSDLWTCYDLERAGDRFRFIGPDRSVSEGAYPE